MPGGALEGVEELESVPRAVVASLISEFMRARVICHPLFLAMLRNREMHAGW